MGYAIFANRKISLTNQINTLQMELEEIMNQKQKLLNYSANIATGNPTTEDRIADFTNAENYDQYQQDFDLYLFEHYYAGDNTENGTFYTTFDEEIGNDLCNNFDMSNADFNTYVMANVGDTSNMTDDELSEAINAQLETWSQSSDAEAIDAYNRYMAQRDTYEQNLRNRALSNIGQEYYNNVESKRIAALENTLELKQKRIETKLTALKTDLQSVEQAEGQAIQNATPKYSGVA